jgi:putative FmdB family regulatory protein
MPTYEYKCLDCGRQFEVFQRMTDDPLTTCEECEGKLKRLIGAGAGIIFKGSGFYCTDYRSNTYQQAAKSDSSSSSESSSKTSSESSPSKDTKSSSESKKS